MVIRFPVFFFFLVLNIPGFGQIKGRVLDASDRHPISNVHVVHQSGQTTTNDSGYFELPV